MTETTTTERERRRPAMLAAAAAVAALLVVGGVALLTSGDDDPPRLDLGTAAPGPLSGGPEGERVAEDLAPGAMASDGDMATDDIAGMSMMAWVRYVAGDDLPDFGGSAPVYRLVGGDDELRSIARHLGLEGEVVDADGMQRSIVDGDASVSGYGASWWYSSGRPYPGSEDHPDGTVSSECAARAQEPGTDDVVTICEGPTPQPEPERPADLPSQAEAEAIVRALAEAAGLDLAGARVTSYDNVVTWGVNIDLALDGTPIPGWSVYGTVMEGGEILDAGGSMGGIEEVGDYPLDTTRAAIDRMNEQTEASMAEQPTIEPAPADQDLRDEDPAGQAEPADGGGVDGSAGAAPADGGDAPPPDEMTIMPVEGDGEPVEVTLHRGEMTYSLMGNADGTETYLVPTYLLDGTTDQGEEWTDVFFVAVRAEFLGV